MHGGAGVGVSEQHDGGRALGNDRLEASFRERTDTVRPLRWVPLPVCHGRRLSLGARMFEGGRWGCGCACLRRPVGGGWGCA
ncbi:putative NUDIX hydrolase [Streptomyces viridochromogenes Tue57]|uniref:Putative NUDIX hydrolase n=1 Tax=Streptomyces viridochromogenes Tue57 TaxID=1160705 RepID=L8PCA7_STRVR|nr:putative NUDIX hydrolase [Streptomyces viridochromogenes Tue57]